jgi:citrate synthase
MGESSRTGFVAGLEDVVAAETCLSGVDGEAGELTIAGFQVEELAGLASFEETVYLLWHDVLPDPGQLADFRDELAGRRELPLATLDLLRAVAAEKVPVMDALRMAAGTVRPGTDEEEALALVASLPTFVAAYSRMLEGEEIVDSDPGLGHAANYLYMLTGEIPGAEFVRALETYLNAVADHGMNASTFVARVIVSTRSDFVSAVVGAIGALKGPLHGGAPGPALDVVFEIGDVSRAEAYLREKLGRGERLMGFGHRIYRVRDPRADVLAAAAERLYTTDGDRELYDLALGVEQTALRLLAEHKPGRNLQTNVEFYTALLLHGLGLPTQLFTPTFAAGRVAGWTGHCAE